MSKELELLQEAIFRDGGEPTIALPNEDLRRILARLEAAERVCESIADRVDVALELEAIEGSSPWYEARWGRANQRASEIEAALAERLVAYRALDGKGEG